MKRIIALTSLLFVLLMAVLPARGLQAEAVTNVEITGISITTAKGEEIKAAGNKNNFNFNLTKYSGDTSIDKIEFYSPNAVSISFIPVDVLEPGENIDDYGLKFVNGVATLDKQKFVNWLARVSDQPVEDIPVEENVLTIQDIRDEYAFNDFLALELYAYDAAGNESVVKIDYAKSKGWFLGNGKWYYFNDQLALVKGWLQTGGKWYVMGQDGAMLENAWYRSSGKWYYLGSTGAMATNSWVLDGNTWYHVDAKGVMQTGWLYTGGKWYFLEASGAMKTGWKLVGGKWYFLDQKNGDMQTGWELVNGKWYFLQSSGAMKTGWLYTGGKWYFLQSSGAMKTGWLYTGGKWYYLYSNGSMAANTTIDGYRLGKDGVWIR